MSTTSVIVEMLIIGFFTAVWLFLFCLRLSFIDFQSVKSFVSQIGAWSTPLLFISAALFYQLGLLMNSISHKIVKRLLANEFSYKFMQKLVTREIRDQIVPSKVYEKVKATVWQKGSAEVIKNLESYLTFSNVSRHQASSLMLEFRGK